MSRRFYKSSNDRKIYIIAIVAIVIAFFLLGGATWFKGASHGGSSAMGTLQWGQILISLGVGFLLGILFSRRRNW
jgi:drug/metabolite transporter (DMT)-like permease